MDDRKKSEGNVHDGRFKPPFTSSLRQGLASRVVDIEGKTLMPRRGSVSSTTQEPAKFNVIDELTKITVPVSLDGGQPDRNSDDSSFKADEFQEEENKGNRPLSYAHSVMNGSGKKLNFRSFASLDRRDDCDVVLPKESIRVVKDKLANTLYGYFLGDRIAFPVVDYFVKNNWKKFGLEKTMMNANGFYFFKFADNAGMLAVLNGGPWIIRSQPFFLNEWSPTTKLVKKEVKNMQIWVKIHEVPLAAYTEDGLSLIATAIGEPKLLDSYTTSMCLDSWGRSSYARALIEVSAENNLKEEITMAVPELEGDGYVKETMYVEYEWNPHRCSHCCVFGHTDDNCPKQPRKMGKNFNGGKQDQPSQQDRSQGKKPVVDDEGYMGVHAKKVARKGGFPVNKQKPKFEYRPIGPKPKESAANSSGQVSSVKTSNPFEVLNLDDNVETGQSSKQGGGDQVLSDEEEEEVMEGFNETNEFMMEGTLNPNAKKGASTPYSGVTNG
ncbi:putative transcription factor interactor and regulator CCHC(Zn) family [Helianthus annuus]|nr:putative transcription factor interactor and regulator CCHC(Zn) family [Helianthus annuus]